MSIEYYVYTMLIEQVLHFHSHAFCFSVLCLECAVPRRIPNSHQPWSHIPVNIIQISFQPLVLIRCERKSRELYYVADKNNNKKKNVPVHVNKEMYYIHRSDQMNSLQEYHVMCLCDDFQAR